MSEANSLSRRVLLKMSEERDRLAQATQELQDSTAGLKKASSYYDRYGHL